MASETSLEPSPEHVRTPSRSGSQLTLDEETIADEGGRHNSRPGILQSHNHSSSDQSQIQGASFRALRFQSSSSTTSLYSKARSGIIRVLGGLEPSDQQQSLGTRRSCVPTDIDIHSISSYARAEELVPRARRSVLDMGEVTDEAILGRSPLSAKLAEYGETLALERRLKRVEDNWRGFQSKGAPIVLTRDIGKRSRSPPGRNMGTLEPGKPANPSRTKIRRRRRRPITCVSSTFFSFVRVEAILNISFSLQVRQLNHLLC
jgi:hypothetical protein